MINPYGILAVIIAYFIGNISPAIILGKLNGIDIKKEGSGNAGTTNVLRVLGKKAAVITLIVDILKGFLAVKLGMILNYDVAIVCALAVFCGHIWPCLYKFRGGKGVATAFGAVVSVNWVLGLLALGIVAILVLITRRMSVGSIIAAALFPVLCYFLEPRFIVIGCIMAAIVLIKHRSNISRLIKGEEPKMSFKK